MRLNEYYKLMKGMVFNDIKREYAGSTFGFLWAFIQPVSIVFVLWFVFEVGFKAKPIEDIPFVLWLASGLLPWFFFSNSISKTSSSIFTQNYLVKKISFPTIILPIVKILSQLLVHIFMMLILALFFLLHGLTLDIYWIQLLYYMLASLVLLSGLGWIFSSFVIFIQDLKNLIPILIQFGFWVTPIFWSISKVPLKYQIYVKANPFVFLIQGYRDSMINKVWFWERGLENLYFWSLSLLLFFLGYFVFRRLKSHFVDVL